MDIAVLLQYGPEFNWQWIEQRLAELKMRKFAHACYCLIEFWFGIEPPLHCERLADTDEPTEKIVHNGVFGFADADNKRNWTRNFLVMGRTPRWFNRIVLLLYYFFPSYDIMVNYPGCAFLEKHKYLMPLAWIVRFAYLLRRGDFNKAKSTLKGGLISRRDLKKHTERIRKMGL